MTNPPPIHRKKWPAPRQYPAEPWVRALEDDWKVRSQPGTIGELCRRSCHAFFWTNHLYDAFVQLRRITFAMMLRVDSHLPIDPPCDRPDLVEAAKHITAARAILARAIGEDRLTELEGRLFGDRGEEDES